MLVLSEGVASNLFGLFIRTTRSILLHDIPLNSHHLDLMLFLAVEVALTHLFLTNKHIDTSSCVFHN